jgi:hypothetical protein
MPTAALYPKLNPPQPTNALNVTPMDIASMQGQLQNQQIQRAQFGSQLAVGRAVQGATDASGNVDPTAAMAAIANDPNAALGAPDMAAKLLELRGRQIANSTAALGLISGQNDEIARITAPLASDNSTDAVNSVKAQLARAGLASSLVAGITRDNAKEIGTQGQLRLQGAGSAAPVNIVDPNTGQPGLSTAGAVSAASNKGGTVASGLAPGTNADITTFNADMANSAQTSVGVQRLKQIQGILGQLGTLGTGPGSQGYAGVATALQQLGIAPETAQDPNTLRQVLNELTARTVANMPSSGRSDSALAQAQASGPNLGNTLSANQAIVKNIIGQESLNAQMPMFIGRNNQGQGAAASQNYQFHRADFAKNTDYQYASAPMTRAEINAIADPTQRQKALNTQRAMGWNPQ